MEAIKRNRIKKPFEIIQKENEYYVLDSGIRLLAAKAVGYDKVPGFKHFLIDKNFVSIQNA